MLSNETHLTTVIQVCEMLKLARCPPSLIASLATLPSMSLTPFAPFARRMSRFPARHCIMKYETILFCKKETAACAGDNHLDRARNIHRNICPNHYHL